MSTRLSKKQLLQPQEQEPPSINSTQNQYLIKYVNQFAKIVNDTQYATSQLTLTAGTIRTVSTTTGDDYRHRTTKCKHPHTIVRDLNPNADGIGECYTYIIVESVVKNWSKAAIQLTICFSLFAAQR